MSDTMELLQSLAKQGVIIWGEGSRLRFRASKGALTEAMRSELTSHKDSVLSAWRERAGQSVVSHPAAHGQRALWFLHQSHPGSAAYNVVFSARVRSAIDLPALRRSFQALMDRHPSLRTTFREESDRLVQRRAWLHAGLLQRSPSARHRFADAAQRNSRSLRRLRLICKTARSCESISLRGRRTTRSFFSLSTTSQRMVGHSSCFLTIYDKSIRRSEMAARHRRRVRCATFSNIRDGRRPCLPVPKVRSTRLTG